MILKNEKGFSVIEGIIVAVILSILVAIIITNIDLSYGMGSNNKKSSADGVQARQTRSLMSEAQRQVGMPNIVNFQQRKLMKMVYELCDKEELICYAYIKSDYQGKLVYIGKCIGFGLPFSAQFTNPMRIWDQELEGGARGKYNDGGEIQVLPQADPNGLFMPTSSSATWLMMIDPDTNETRPVYIESEITVSPFPLKYNVIGGA